MDVIWLRSSADLDHPLREMARRSPRVGWVWLEAMVGLLGADGTSKNTGARGERSRTDLKKEHEDVN